MFDLGSFFVGYLLALVVQGGAGYLVLTLAGLRSSRARPKRVGWLKRAYWKWRRRHVSL